MSIEAIIWVRKHAPVENATEMCILYSLADRANDDGTGCWPSNETIADEARCSERTVQRHMKELASRGLIVPGDERLVASYRSDRRPNVWDLNMSLGRDDTGCQNDTPNKSGVPSGVQRGDNGGNHGVSSGAERGDTVVTQTILNPPIEPPVNHPPLTPQGGTTGGELDVIESIPVPEKPAPKKSGTNGHRLPAEWMPTQRSIDLVRNEHPGITDEILIREHRKFSDHWAAATGQRARKKDWDATWRNWIRTAMERYQPRGRSTGKPTMQEINAWTTQPTITHEEPNSDYQPF